MAKREETKSATERRALPSNSQPKAADTRGITKIGRY